MSRIELIKKRLEAATPGPWDNRCYNTMDNTAKPRYLWSEYGWLAEFCSPMNSAVADAEFTANAPTDIAYLLSEVARLEGELKLCKTALKLKPVIDTPEYNEKLEAKLKRQDEMIEACENGLKDICIRCKGVNGRQPVYESAQEALTKLKKLREQDSE